MTKTTLHILIVDDNTICAQILARIFTSKEFKEIATFHVTTLNSAEEALSALKNTSYDIIFTDIEMTGMHGDDMARTIRNKITGNTPIIAITCKDDEASRVQYEKAGITACLKKPAKKESIYAIVMTSL